MVITVEPGRIELFNALTKALIVVIGIYVPPTSSFPKHFHNIGIRIEASG